MRQAVLEHSDKVRQATKKMHIALYSHKILLKEELARQQTNVDELKIAFFKRVLKDSALCTESILVAEKIIKGV